jgi:signal transduction histidine kinase
MMRGGFIWQAGCLATLVLLSGAVGLIVLLWHLATAVGFSAGGAGGIAVLAVLGLAALLGAAAAGRAVRRFAMPFADLIDAAGRVEGGDYSVRVPERVAGPPPVQTLVRSFNGMTARLEANERQRRTLLADIGHELRTPLTVLQGELEAMLDGVHPPDGPHIEAALDETRVMARLIDDLRTLALADAGTLALHPEPTDLDVLIAEAARSMGAAAEAAGVTISTDLPDDLPLLDIDPVRIREVLTNLLANALRYAPSGSAVTVTARRRDDGLALLVSVADAGAGIPAELLPHVFERFTKSADSRGSGLGLAIARQLVEAHGGHIGVEDAPPTGTRFWFDIPLTRSAD